MVSLILFMFFKAHHDIVEYRSIVDNRLPESFEHYCLFYISDIHRRKINAKKLETNNKELNIIVIGEELTEKDVTLKRTQHNLRLLKQFGVPIYFVWGNNDYEIEFEKLIQLLNEEHIIILKDSYINITHDKHTLNLIGFDYHENGEDYGEIDWSKMIGDYRVLLTHVPQAFYELDPIIQGSIHTVLAGHTDRK